MHMVIDIGGIECGPWVTKGGFRIDEPCDRPNAAGGHMRISIWNAAQPFWERRPPWARLEVDMRPPKGAVETLRWAVRTLDASLRAPMSPTFSDDDWEVAGPVYEHPF